MFDIGVASKSNEIIESVFYRKCYIKLDNHEEFFLAPLSYWKLEDYYSHWNENISSFVSKGIDKTFLITEMYDPNIANFIRWWVVYRKNDLVVFQEEILFLHELETPFSLCNACEYIPKYQNINEDGDEISEWILPISSVASSPITLR